MATTEKPPPYIGQPLPARRTPSSSPAAPATPMTSPSPGCSGPTSSAAPSPTRRSTASTSRRPSPMEGCVAAFSGADLAERVARAARLRVAGHRRHQDERALAAREGQGPPRRRRRRRRRRDEPRVLAKDAAELVEVELGAAAGRDRPARGDGGRRPAGARRLRHQRLERLGVREGRLARPAQDLQALLRRPRPGEGEAPLPAEAADPERHGAALRAGGAEPRRWASSRCTRPARSRTSCAPRRPSPAASPRRSCAWSPPTSAAASARSSTPTPRSRSAWRWPGGWARRSSGPRSAPRATSPRSTAATSTPTWRWPRRATAS